MRTCQVMVVCMYMLCVCIVYIYCSIYVDMHDIVWMCMYCVVFHVSVFMSVLYCMCCIMYVLYYAMCVFVYVVCVYVYMYMQMCMLDVCGRVFYTCHNNIGWLWCQNTSLLASHTYHHFATCLTFVFTFSNMYLLFICFGFLHFFCLECVCMYGCMYVCLFVCMLPWRVCAPLHHLHSKNTITSMPSSLTCLCNNAYTYCGFMEVKNVIFNKNIPCGAKIIHNIQLEQELQCKKLPQGQNKHILSFSLQK